MENGIHHKAQKGAGNRKPQKKGNHDSHFNNAPDPCRLSLVTKQDYLNNRSADFPVTFARL